MPRAHAGLVAGWGVDVVGSSVVRGAVTRSADIVLGPVSHVPLASRTPQIVWACDVTPPRGTRTELLGRTLARVLLARSSLVVYPTAAARHRAETAGLKGPGLILRSPVREPRPPADKPAPRGPTGLLRILVPADDQRRWNLELLPRLSAVLAGRGVEHRISVPGSLPPGLGAGGVTGGFEYDRDDLHALRDRVDVALVTALEESCCSPVVEFERSGLPVAASNIDAHVELRDRARLFGPASPHGAADAVLAAVADGGERDVDHSDWRCTTPTSYAAAVSAEIDRLVGGGEIPWAV